MKDYQSEYKKFSLSAPEKFSFPLDVFDKWKPGPALYWTDGVIDKKLSFAELKLFSSKGASALKNRGIRKGDKVLVMLPGIPEWWEIMLALMRINAIPIPTTILLTSKDIEYRLAAADIKAIITADEDAPKVEIAVNNTSANPILILVGENNPPQSPINVKGGKGGLYGERQGWHNYIKERDKADAFEGERAFSSEPALIYFTSGTTGPPKMALHTQGFRPSNALIKELQEFVKNRTAPYKYPRKIEFVDDLPKTISGKIKRKELKIKEFGKT